MDERMSVIKRNFLPDDLAPLLAAQGFAGCVAVQASQSLDETRWLLELSDAYPFIVGVVGWVDLRAPGVGAQLARFAGHPRFKGVRHVVHDEPDDGFLLRDDVQRGIAALNDARLVYDLLIFPRHIPVAVECARRNPAVTFVLDHLAKPSIRTGEMESWRAGLRALAACPNVACKLSGMVTEADWSTWSPADLKPYLDVAVEAFGPQRLMIGSDWPVCNLAGPYGVVMQAVMDWSGALALSEREQVLGGTAARWYRL
jgi:L-fuconolactonase